MALRREVLRTLSAAAAAAAIPGWSSAGRADRLKRIGVQLYTVRSALKADFDGTLRKVAAIGYKEVEFAGYMGRTPEEVRASLKQAGLSAPAEHVDLETLEKDWNATVDAAHTVGHEYLVVAWIDAARRSTIDEYKRIADIFNRLGRQANAAGLRFGYHNHAYEMIALEGQVPYDVLLQNTDPDLVCFEMDLYWTTDGGKDPLAYFAKYPGRFPLVHVKDRTANGQMVDVGQGTIDWTAIFAHRKQAGIKHEFVEHDEPGDPFASIAASYAYLKALRFPNG
jgi:sugar phosphate isomerase/epimerase